MARPLAEFDRIARERLEAEQRAVLRRALLEATATTGADWLVLRGLPAIGRGVSGAIRGTDPVHETNRQHGEWSGPARTRLGSRRSSWRRGIRDEDEETARRT